MRTTTLNIFRPVMALVALLSACSPSDPSVTKLQYVPDMADAPTVKTQRDYLDPPEGSVAMSAPLYPKTVEAAEKLLIMPKELSGSDKALADGKLMFETYCTVCHGADGKGQGTVVGPDLVAPPPDISGDFYAQKGDGFFFYRITFGGALMPGYGHATTPSERWTIIRYLRTLQKGGKQ